MTRETRKAEKIKLVEGFYEEYGRLPKQKEKYKGKFIGMFLNSIKQRQIKLTEEQMNRLLQLGFQMDTINRQAKKEQKIKLVEEFYEEYGRLPKKNEKYKGAKLDIFLQSIRRGYTKITEEQKTRLKEIGYVIEKKDIEEKKLKKIELLEEFYKEYGRLPKRYEKYKEKALGQFLNNIRHGVTQVTEEQMERLIKLGFQGQINDIKVDIKIKQVEQFYQVNNRLPEQDEKLGREKPKVGEFLLSIKIGKVKITERQFLRLQQMDTTLTREQVKFIEKSKIYVKK